MTAISAALASWQVPFWPTAAMLLTAVVYWRGWRVLRVQMPDRFGAARLAAFLGGLAAIWIALASPLDAFAPLLLQAHMIQHVLLTMIGPPLLWLGAPAAPLLRGLPQSVGRDGLGPFLASPALRAAGRAVVHPITAWLAFALALAIWHLPAPYELALRSPAWHEVEHATFLLAALLFWFPIVQPWPSRPAWPRAAMVPYLLLADLENTALAAVLLFSERVIYPTYAAAPRLAGFSALGDQAAAGALMWVIGSLAFLVPAGLIVRELLQPELVESEPRRRRSGALQEIRWSTVRRGDLLKGRLVGPLLRWRHARRAVQGVMLLLAAAVVVDGFVGPRMGPMNLAGVLPWTYWRGAVVIGLLVAGNLFCFACPFMLPREAAKRWFRPGRVWPRWLRGKWLAVGLLVVYLWAYEAFDIWDSPSATAMLVLLYFAAAFAVDALFRGAGFCKYVCPIGQFHFTLSLASPLAVAVRDAATCATCTTHDCIRGNARARGCELELFQPEKRGNMDCTFCLDCVHACPHDNVGVLVSQPLRDLASDPFRSSVRRLSERPDIALLTLVVVAGAFANAAGMIAPVVAFEDAVLARGDLAHTWPLAGIALLAALIIAPGLAVALAAAAGRSLAGVRTAWNALACRVALTLIPLGLAMWSAHFLFHLLTGAGTLAPVVQRIAHDLDGAMFGAPVWAMSGAMAATTGTTELQLLLLDAGLLATLYTGWRTALDEAGVARRALLLWAPSAVLGLALWAAGVWIVFQPMEMRGMVH